MKTNTIQQITTKLDRNGNKTARIQCVEGTFSLQTLDNMPLTHREGVSTWSPKEINVYVSKHGTERQKKLCDIGQSVNDKA